MLAFWGSSIHKRVNWCHNVRGPTPRPKDRRGRIWIGRTQSSGSHYWGRTPLLRTPITTGETAGSADLCTLLHCSGLDTECNRSCRKSTRKLLKSTTRPSTWEPWLEFLQRRHIALELYIWVSFCKTGKILELCLILTYFNQGGQMCPHPKYANTYTRKKSMGGNSDNFCIFLNVC